MASRQREYQREYQRRHVALGLCKFCRDPIARSGMCERHYEAHAILNRNKYRRKHGIEPSYEPVQPNSRRSA